MSLLLDALRKAADAKEQRTAATHEVSSDGKEEIREPNIEPSVDAAHTEIQLEETYIADVSNKLDTAEEPAARPVNQSLAGDVSNDNLDETQRIDEKRQQEVLFQQENVSRDLAQTVLLSPAAREPLKQGFGWQMLLWPLVIVLLLGAFAYYQYESQDGYLKGLLTDVKRRVPLQNEADQVVIEPPEAKADEQVHDEEPDVSNIIPLEGMGDEVAPIEQKPVSPPKNTASAATKPEKTVTASSTPPVGSTPVPVGEVNIAPTVPSRALESLIQKGFSAYQTGQLAVAQEAYQEAMLIDDRNLDAQMGMAAVLARQGKQREALSIYQNILQRDPSNQHALLGITSLSQQGSLAQLEPSLKSLLAAHPRSSSLHFALGALYSKAGRWRDAQASFFAAWTAAPENADYVFNLAVSLDNLGQKQAAREHYQRALSLAEGRSVSFNKRIVLRRINQLKDQ